MAFASELLSRLISAKGSDELGNHLVVSLVVPVWATKSGIKDSVMEFFCG